MSIDPAQIVGETIKLQQQAAAENERAAIVAWLKENAGELGDGWDEGLEAVCRIVNAIARGDHITHKER